jgi:hypothetical protein
VERERCDGLAVELEDTRVELGGARAELQRARAIRA